MHPTKDDIGKKVRVRSDATDCGDYVGQVGTLLKVHPQSDKSINPPADVQVPQFHNPCMPAEESSEWAYFWLSELDLMGENNGDSNAG